MLPGVSPRARSPGICYPECTRTVFRVTPRVTGAETDLGVVPELARRLALLRLRLHCPSLLLCFGLVADLGWLSLLSLCFCLNWCRWLDRVCFWLVAYLGWWPNWHNWCRWLDGLCCWLCCLCLQLGNLPQQILLLLLPLLLSRRLVCLPPCPLHLVPLLAPLLCLEGLLRL